ncbi:MAG: hypothetical protein AAGA75_21480 [Cyanobacteria bacterium P01_E01_bin.6]
MAEISLHSFCKKHNLAKSTTHRLCRDLGIDVSNGLSDEAQAQLTKVLKLEEKGEVKPISSELVPSSGYGLGSIIPSTNGGSIHLHVHMGDREYFKANASANRNDLSALIGGLMENADQQGLADGQEVEQLVQSVKTGVVKKRLESMALGQQGEIETA